MNDAEPAIVPGLLSHFCISASVKQLTCFQAKGLHICIAVGDPWRLYLGVTPENQTVSSGRHQGHTCHACWLAWILLGWAGALALQSDCQNLLLIIVVPKP